MFPDNYSRAQHYFAHYSQSDMLNRDFVGQADQHRVRVRLRLPTGRRIQTTEQRASGEADGQEGGDRARFGRGTGSGL